MSQPRKYTKRPVTIEAIQYDGTMTSALDILNWIGDPNGAARRAEGALTIHTLEGDMTATPGDYIIRGVQGEYYPCKPDIFEATYEPGTSAPETASAKQVAALHEALDVLDHMQAEGVSIYDGERIIASVHAAELARVVHPAAARAGTASVHDPSV